VPAGSMTCAMMSVDPLTGSAVVVESNVMIEPLGARSGTFVQAEVKVARTTSTATLATDWKVRGIMDCISILIHMGLAGQAASKKNQQGYAMAALLVAMSIMAIMMTVVMPVWKQAAQREKEAELIFRGQQYAHAIGLFQKKFANAFPPNIDVLVEQRFLRKKFKDPITNDDFLLLPGGAGAAAPGTGAPGSATPGAQPAGGQPGGQPPGGGSGTTTARQPSQAQGGRGGTGSPTQPGGALRGVSDIGTPGAGGGTTAGVGGVASKSKEQSIRLYNGRNHYNEWAFVYVPQVQAPAAGAPGTATPGPLGPLGPGGRGGQRGSSPFDGPAGSGRRGGQPQPPPSPRGRF
jgi:type II secretory pathway pseudopilin PulG